MEYWDRENSRRAELRKLYKARVREVARREGGYFYWTGWRGWKNFRLFYTYAGKTRRQIELEKLALKDHPHIELLRERQQQKRNSALLLHKAHTERAESTHSRSSSRSSTPTPEPEGRQLRTGEQDRARRRGSSAGSQRKAKKAGAPGALTSRLSATETLMQDVEIPMPLSKRHSTLSTSSRESDEGVSGAVVKKEEGEGDDGVEVKIEQPAEA